MKTILFTLALTISVGFSTEKKINKNEDIKLIQKLSNEKAYVINFCRSYAPEYVSLLQTNYSSPNSWSITVGGVSTKANFTGTWEEIVDEFESIIHETTHDKNSFSNIYVDNQHFYELIGDEAFNPQNHFKSELISEYLPVDANEKIFRFTYIEKNCGQVSNLKGIFGLMNEYSAYQNGCTAALIAYETALNENNTELAVKLFKEALGTYFAYYEFNSFIGAYIKYAKIKNPDCYQKIMSNNTLRKAYTENTKRFDISLQKIQNASSKLKTNYKLVEYTFNYNEKKYVEYAKTCMNSFKEELTTFKLN
jgi:hypothetical protein